MWTLKFRDGSTDKCVQTVVHSSDNETVLGSSRELGGPAEHLIDGSEKRICRSTFEFYSSHVIEKSSKAPYVLCQRNLKAQLYFYG